MTAMVPQRLPAKTPSEMVSVYFQLAPHIGTDLITGVPIFSSDPPELLITYATVLDDGKTAAALVGGGEANTVYTVSALCTLVSGQVLQPVVALPVVEPASETMQRRPVTL